ncbi:PREDICTED: outer envelope pore protein 21B, chloroplastic isoform X2 [Theobroma cacao]|uniref:Outer envelope pore protein 21B, chloroplastic isoform X2 n=2 Tax=Theobroma cacao TaxID=3641 RepID=A0AB32WTB5_THECC|nr:PREDICTED: outer envelope pore protein 21B, chloroplastic isoform X2 [Theobroma cacao]EOY15341.1 Chloroplast channel forming outer membrane protein isoform 2 [Theobroma cacao]
METSLRYGGDSKALRIHAKEKFPIDSKTHLQVRGELDTKTGAPGNLCAMIRHFYPDRKSEGAAEFSFSIFNFQKDQDVRLKLGYEVFDKVPYMQIRENNWTLNADMNGRWNIRYDL